MAGQEVDPGEDGEGWGGEGGDGRGPGTDAGDEGLACCGRVDGADDRVDQVEVEDCVVSAEGGGGVGGDGGREGDVAGGGALGEDGGEEEEWEGEDGVG